MGCDYSADVIIGFKLKYLNPTQIIKKTEKKKFNSETGEPYMVIQEDKFTVFGGLEIPGDLKTALRFFTEDIKYELEDDEINPLGDYYPFLHTYQYMTDCSDDDLIENAIIGFSLAHVGAEYDTNKTVDEEQIENFKQEIKDWLKYILKIENIPVELHVAMSVSY